MEPREFEGKSIDEAISKACSVFGVPRTKLNIDILCEGSAGFLGLGAKKAQIRASLFEIDLHLDTAFTGPAPKAVDRSAVTTMAPSTPQKESKVPGPEQTSPLPIIPCAASSMVEAGGNESSTAKAKRILEGLLAHMQIAAPVQATETEEAIVLDIEGDGSGLLIGKRGQNLDAIQYLVNKAVHHSINGHKMIVIDTEGYRERREAALQALASRIGEKVKKTGKPMTVGHMNAHDRRIIHLALQNDSVLTTRSRGEGDYRSILILPARRGSEETGT